MKMLMGGGMPGMPGLPGAMGGRKAAARSKAAKNAKGKRKSGDPRKAGLAPVASNGPAELPAAAAQAAPQSMEELAELLRDAQAAGGPVGLGTEAEGFPGRRSGPSALPPAFGGGRPAGNIPAAFGKRDKNKK
jgi:signal recognition particle subunit SRP54